jgi:hypothetical protein
MSYAKIVNCIANTPMIIKLRYMILNNKHFPLKLKKETLRDRKGY